MKRLLIFKLQGTFQSNVLREKMEVIMAIEYLRGPIVTLIATLHHKIRAVMGVGSVSG